MSGDAADDSGRVPSRWEALGQALSAQQRSPAPSRDYCSVSSSGGGGRWQRPSTGGGGGYPTSFRRQYSQPSRRPSSSATPQKTEAELFDGTGAGLNFDDYSKIPVSLSGADPPAPFEAFSELNLHANLSQNIARANYSKPTPVQKNGVRVVLGRRDLMACAQTGSGKTAAFLIPIIHHLLSEKPAAAAAQHGPRCLIITPTRELCLQIYQEALRFSYKTPLKVVVVYGGTDFFAQKDELRRGVDILAATPGRLIDLLKRAPNTLSLANARFLVLDEADRMLDMGFEPQIRRIVLDLPPKGTRRQTLMFSATFPSEIQKLAAAFLDNYVFLCVGRVGSTSENISQQIMLVDEREKTNILLELLRRDPDDLTLVFVETKRGADHLHRFLLQQGFRAECIHGDRSQHEREHALGQFKKAHASILVATAVAARGLDVPNVKHVINYDMPSDIDEYVHRIGRTGRVGNAGKATGFFTEKNMNIVQGLVEILNEAKQDVPDFLRAFAMRGNSSSSGGGSRRPRYARSSVQYGGGTNNRPATRYGGFDIRRNEHTDQSSSSSSTQPPLVARRASVPHKDWWADD